MKTLFCFRMAVIALSLAALCATANASYNHPSVTLVDRIKPNILITKPKLSYSNPHPSPYIKLASVRFVTDRSRMVNFNCPEGWEYKNGWCRVAACEGYPYTNAAQTANCAAVDTCLSGDVMKYKCRGCKTNLVSDGNGGCYCDTSVYKYDVVSNPCSYKYDESTACTYVNAAGTASTSYADCLCSPEWVQCESTRHHVGSGDVCVSKGKEFFAQCQCNTNYQKTCIGERPIYPSDYCVNPQDGVRYYSQCYRCNQSQGQYYDKLDYWCEDGNNHDIYQLINGWYDFPVVRQFYTH